MILMEQVKRDAVEELFGTMLQSKTEVVDGRLVSDRVKQVAVGSVRIKGKPQFFNGKNWGEVCTKAEAYITEEDFQRYQPQTVILEHFCHNNPNVSLKDLKKEAYNAAYKKVITRFRPGMKNVSSEQAEAFMHGFEVRNEKLDLQTGIYCMDVTAELFPYELEMGAEIAGGTAGRTVHGSENGDNGLEVGFFENYDFAMRQPVFRTTLRSDLALFGRKFVGGDLKADKAYFVRLNGFIYSDSVRYLKYKLEADVFNATVKINDTIVVSKQAPEGGVHLKAGYNPIEIVISTSNAYDIRLTERQSDGSFAPVRVSELFIKE